MGILLSINTIAVNAADSQYGVMVSTSCYCFIKDSHSYSIVPMS